jgi:hypothetical protein
MKYNLYKFLTILILALGIIHYNPVFAQQVDADKVNLQPQTLPSGDAGNIAVNENNSLQYHNGENWETVLTSDALFNGLVYWNKLEKMENDTIPSIIGEDIQKLISYEYPPNPPLPQEITIAAGKFKNGLHHINNFSYSTQYDTANGQSRQFLFFKPNVTLEKGTIEFWWKAGVDSAQFHHLYFFSGVKEPFTTYPDSTYYKVPRVGLAWDGYNYSGSYGKRFTAGLDIGSSFERISVASPNWQTFAKGDVMHFAISWDQNGISGEEGKTFILYINGVEAASSTDTWTSKGEIPYLSLGTYPTRFGASTHAHAFGVYDNIMIWNYAKTDFSQNQIETPAIALFQQDNLYYSIFEHLFGSTLNVKNGNVGIGVTNPVNPLEVAGTIRAEELIIESGWADFVFDDNYKLHSIEEVEKHIKEKKHLPGLPTEQEVKNNGVKMGEMQVKLLQKVEELTLYMIQLNKENEELKRKIEQLEKN